MSQYLLGFILVIVLAMINHSEIIEKWPNRFEIEINQEIFLYKESKHEIYETYKINNNHIKRKLGKFVSDNFVWENSIHSNFIKRRSNFHGLVLKSMVEWSGNNMNANPNFIQNAPYFSENNTYLGNHHLHIW